MYNQNPDLMMVLAGERMNDLKHRAQAESPRFTWPFRRQRPAPAPSRPIPYGSRRKAY